MNSEQQKNPEMQPGEKKTYETPELVEHGTIAKLTQGPSPVGTEGNGTMFNPCL